MTLDLSNPDFFRIFIFSKTFEIWTSIELSIAHEQSNYYKLGSFEYFLVFFNHRKNNNMMFSYTISCKFWYSPCFKTLQMLSVVCHCLHQIFTKWYVRCDCKYWSYYIFGSFLNMIELLYWILSQILYLINTYILLYTRYDWKLWNLLILLSFSNFLLYTIDDYSCP